MPVQTFTKLSSSTFEQRSSLESQLNEFADLVKRCADGYYEDSKSETTISEINRDGFQYIWHRDHGNGRTADWKCQVTWKNLRYANVGYSSLDGALFAMSFYKPEQAWKRLDTSQWKALAESRGLILLNNDQGIKEAAKLQKLLVAISARLGHEVALDAP